MSSRADTLSLIQSLESCIGAVPLGARTRGNSVAGADSRRAVLNAPLPSNASIVVKPRTQDDVVRLVTLACRQQISVLSKGWIVGKQPMAEISTAESVRLDLTGLDRMTQLRGQSAYAEPGIMLTQFERACRKSSWPGLDSGSVTRERLGHAITGRIDALCRGEQLAGLGYLESVKVVTIEQAPQVLTLSAKELQKLCAAQDRRAVLLEVGILLAIMPAALPVAASTVAVPAANLAHLASVRTR